MNKIKQKNKYLFVATNTGIIVCTHQKKTWCVEHKSLLQHSITSITAHNNIVFAGTIDGICRSTDFGENWHEVNEGLKERHVRWISFNPDNSDYVFAGCEPAGIFTITPKGNKWYENTEVAELREKHKWFLPYSPQAGCVRAFAFYKKSVYAAVEIGGLLVLDSPEKKWHLVNGSTGSPETKQIEESFLHPDVHSIELHPSLPRIYAATGGGLYLSKNGGNTWALLYKCYCRAIWIDPENPKHLILGSADSVNQGGRIEETFNSGKTWKPRSDGLEIPWKNYMVDRFYQTDYELFAILSNGSLISTSLKRIRWQAVLSSIKGIKALCVTNQIKKRRNNNEK